MIPSVKNPFLKTKTAEEGIFFSSGVGFSMTNEQEKEGIVCLYVVSIGNLLFLPSFLFLFSCWCDDGLYKRERQLVWFVNSRQIDVCID